MTLSRRAFLAGAAAALAGCTSRRPDAGSPASTARPRGASATTTARKAPAGPAEVAFRGPRSSTAVALTFHGSGDTTITARMLDEAGRLGIRISVFAVGIWLEQHPGLASEILARGHELDNHTYTHPELAGVPAAGVATQIVRCRSVLTAQTGSGGRYFRPSGVQVPTPLMLAEAGKAGYPLVVSFDVDPADYTDPGAGAVVSRVAAGLKPGSIVSLHLGHAGTVDALPGIVKAARARGLEPVVASQLLRGLPAA